MEVEVAAAAGASDRTGTGKVGEETRAHGWESAAHGNGGRGGGGGGRRRRRGGPCQGLGLQVEASLNPSPHQEVDMSSTTTPTTFLKETYTQLE